MLIWGGSEGGTVAAPNGGAYNPATNSWSTITNTGAPPAVLNHTAVWNGSRMVVWGGESQINGTARSTGGIYNPQTDSWTSTSTADAPTARALHAAAWTGSRMVIWGGRAFTGAQEERFNSGGRFDPVLNAWSSTNLPSAPGPVAAPTVVWTGDRMIVWGNRAGGRYDPATDVWTPVSFGNTPRPLSFPAAVWTGNLMIVWGGLSETQTVSNLGYRYDPMLGTWNPTSGVSAPAPRKEHAFAWTGGRMVVWGGRNASALQSGGRYDPVADAWSGMALVGSPSARYSVTAVWIGNRVILWGGKGDSPGPLNTGALYDPVGDSWNPMAPASIGRYWHTVVWTGSYMIVYGGEENPITLNRSTAERYMPQGNQWSGVSLTNAPSARLYNIAQWTGSRMLIWGGISGPSDVNTGGAYNPQSDQWTEMATFGAPAARDRATSVWTGREMIVWGGSTNQSVHMNTGGRYDPATNQWLPTSLVGVPSVRPPGHIAVWTGTHMIVWGVNVDAGAYLPDGGDPSDSDSDGWQVCQGDCNDSNPAIHPGAAEACNGVDDNCNGTRDDGFPDLDADGFAACGGDCDDTVPSIHPGAAEACNHRDDDCDGSIDEGFLDGDADGYASCAGDCNDNNAAVNPGAFDGCNGIDDNCNLAVDEGDADGDGTTSCADCNDADPAIHPGAPEVCNGLDDDCDLQVDNRPDADGDGFGQCVDCNDSEPLVWLSPFEVTALTLSPSAQTSLTWDDQSWIGPETLYDIASGLAGPGTGISFGPGSCLQAGQPGAAYMDSRLDPGIGAAYWYLVRARNSCGAGTYGTDHLGQERSLPPCP